MNLFRLFTSSGNQFWVESNMVESAIRKVEQMTGEHVSCWFIGGSRPANATVLTA